MLLVIDVLYNLCLSPIYKGGPARYVYDDDFLQICEPNVVASPTSLNDPATGTVASAGNERREFSCAELNDDDDVDEHDTST